MKTLLGLTAALTLLCSVPAWAECSAEDAVQKRGELAQEVKKDTQQDPAKAREINKEMKGMDLKTDAKDTAPDPCERVDQRIKEVDKATQKTE
jgi:hypothetical protein